MADCAGLSFGLIVLFQRLRERWACRQAVVQRVKFYQNVEHFSNLTSLQLKWSLVTMDRELSGG